MYLLWSRKVYKIKGGRSSMAKEIESTPVLVNEDAERFLKLISSENLKELNQKENELKKIIENLPLNLIF